MPENLKAERHPITTRDLVLDELLLKNVTDMDLENMSFGNASTLVLLGYKAARHAWNAPGQFVTRILPGNAMHLGYPMQPCLGLKNAQGNMQPGWVPSQGDIFATDWYILQP